MNSIMDSLAASLEASFAAALPTPAAGTAALMAVMAAALLRGFTGFGFALAAVPLLSLVMPPTNAVPIAVILQLLTGLNDLRRAREDCHWLSLRWLITGVVVGSPLGALILTIVPSAIARIGIAAITATAVVMMGFGFRLTEMPSRPVTAMIGLASGIFNGIAAMSGPPVIIYYMSGPFRSAVARASLLMFFLAASVLGVLSAELVGLITSDVLWLSALVFPAMLLGTWIGELGFRYGSETLHRTVSVVSLGLIVLLSAAKGLSELI